MRFSISHLLGKLKSIPTIGTTSGQLHMESYSSYLEKMCGELNSRSTLDTKRYLEEVDSELAKLYVASRPMGKDRLEALLFGYKLANLFVCRHDYLNRRVHLAGRPVGFMLDPANGCHLGCASCHWTSNKEFARKTYNVIPAGVMKTPLFDELIDFLGPSAFAGHFYNNSEPYLNKNTSSFVKKAAQLRVRTGISSNMSIPKLDVESIIESRLDDLQIAIDGATQTVYEKYRRGGDIQLVFDNVRRLVEEKRRRGSNTPFIRWHFLTFEHNVHELDAAIEKARELGVDFFFIATPNDVSADTPDIIAVKHPRANQGIHLQPIAPAYMLTDISPAEEIIESVFTKNSFSSRFVPQNEELLETGYCDWLYLATVSDAHGRISPCCIGDIKGHGTFQFGSFKEDGTNVLNSGAYKAARRFVGGRPVTEPIRCKTCHGRPTPQVGLGAVRDALNKLAGDHQWLSQTAIDMLSGWSKHEQ